ncbi:MAG TPA: lysophospholipid acyltransferase family protein [Arenibaculum sp.]|nr:lysophospholipid acyltransferase family protein [Arenibaculum sp.]
MGSSFLGIARIAAYLALTLALLPLQAALVAFRSPLRRRLPVAYHRTCCRLLGIGIEISGRPITERPALFVSNHSSYLDIVVLGALIPGCFVAKAEVGSWPFFGLLARLQQTVFVDRKARNAVSHRDDMRSRLAAGDGLILFPEGTSSDGNRTLPFKTALFSVANLRTGDDRPLPVQPVSITATALDGIPLGRELRSLYAWYGAMDLAPHLWRMVRLGRFTVRVEFHEAVTIDAFPSRKALADHCRRAVSAGVARAVVGRPRPPAREPSVEAVDEVTPPETAGTSPGTGVSSREQS